MLRELYQETILEHGQNPRNFGKLPKADFSAESFNPLCGDRYLVYLQVSHGAIKNISFEGGGCLISKASASLMTECFRGKTLKEAEKMFDFFQKLVKTGKTADKKRAGKLIAFSGISKFPLRIKCALLPWYAAKFAYAR